MSIPTMFTKVGADVAQTLVFGVVF
jgi:hypothetical protein